MIDPFANDHQSMQIGDLTIENQTDKIIIYGDIDLYLNETGLAQAKQLNELTSKILQHFEKTEQYTKTDELSKIKDDRTDVIIDNPFL